MVELVQLTKTCQSVPAEWEAQTTDGRSVYIRYRHGNLVASVGPTVEDAVSIQLATLGLVGGPQSGEMLYAAAVGDCYAGEMEEEEMLARLSEVLALADGVSLAEAMDKPSLTSAWQDW